MHAMERIEIDGVGLELLRIPAPVNAPDPGPAPARAPIVFLHEGLGCVRMWRDWPAQVCAATGRAGFVYSRRGYGGSDPIADVRGSGRRRADYMHEEARRTLAGLCRALGLQRPVLLGHSDGATIALIHAAKAEVSACIAMAPHVMVEPVALRSIEQAREAYLHQGLRERLAKYHADVDSAFWQWNDAWLSEAFRDFDIRALCRGIRAPLLAFQGEGDEYGTRAQLDDIAAAVPHALCRELPDCGHSPHKDQPAASLELVRDFLADQP